MTNNEHDTTLVPLGPFAHRYECICGWVSVDCPNGHGYAGAALVRHLLDAERTP